MLLLKAKFIGITDLPAKGDFPPSKLATVLDDNGESLSLLVCDDETGAQLAKLPELKPVTLKLRWRKVALGGLGGSGNGYRLHIIQLNPKEVS